jgi:hypothetical protein
MTAQRDRRNAGEVSSRHHDVRVYRLFLHPAPQFWVELPGAPKNLSLEHRGPTGPEAESVPGHFVLHSPTLV